MGWREELGSEGVQEPFMAHQDAWIAWRKSLGAVGPCPVLCITGTVFCS